jgi:hypothetical protein
MAKKLVLVPMDLYKGLVTTHNGNNEEDLTDHAPLQYEKSILKKVTKKGGKNLSAKNILYNQQLRRFLKARKQARDRPLKVQFSDDPTNIKILKAGTTPKEPMKVAMVDEDGELQRIRIQQEEPSVRFGSSIEEEYDTPDGRETSGRSRMSQTSYSEYSSNGQNSREIKRGTSTNPPLYNTPIRQKKRAVRLESEVKKEIEGLKFDRLLEIINNNPAKFGVRDGQILNPSTGKPVNKSNLNWAIKRLVSPATQNAPSPVGLKYLHRSLLADEEASQFLHDKYLQKGEGKLGQQYKRNLFRPDKWKK